MLPSAAEILERTASVYASCSSYRDCGEAVISLDKATERERTRPFVTLFVRPDRLRYEFTSSSFRKDAPDERYVVWADGQWIQSWWSVKREVAEQPSISMALAGPTGVSFGSAYRVPSLLLPFPDQRSLPVAATARLREEASAEGERFVLSGPMVWGSETEVWIDVRTFLIQRVHTAYTPRPMDSEERLRQYDVARNAIERRTDLTPEGKERILALAHPALHFSRGSEVTTTYSPEIDVEIPPDAFAFTPPE